MKTTPSAELGRCRTSTSPATVRRFPLPDANQIEGAVADIFAAPIFANLFTDEEGEGYTLIWTRPRSRNGE